MEWIPLVNDQGYMRPVDQTATQHQLSDSALVYCGKIHIHCDISDTANSPIALEVLETVQDRERQGESRWDAEIRFKEDAKHDAPTMVVQLADSVILRKPVTLRSKHVKGIRSTQTNIKQSASVLEAMYRAWAKGLCVTRGTLEVETISSNLRLIFTIRIYLQSKTIEIVNTEANDIRKKTLSVELQELFYYLYPPTNNTLKHPAETALLRCPLVPDIYPLSESCAQLQPSELLPTLLTFQRRAVGWMVAREGVEFCSDGRLSERPKGAFSDAPMFWDKIVTDSGSVLYVNRLTGAISLRHPQAHDNEQYIPGGILAEEVPSPSLHQSPTGLRSCDRWVLAKQLYY